jgi:hypothetical protein
MNIKYLVILFFILLFTNACISSKPKEKPMLLFLLIGQSNMAGRGAVESQDQKVHNQIFVLDKNDQIVPAKEPLHFDKPSAGVGLGFSFAKNLINEYSNIQICLIPCAVGGSPIDAWKAGVYYEPTKTYPYDEAVRRTKLAMQKGKLAGILWHQGESDSKAELADKYEEKLLYLIDNLRNDLENKTVPFVVGTLGDFLTKRNEFAQNINQQITQLPEKVNNSYIVFTKDLKDKGDSLHFDSPSYRELGRRYAKVFIENKLIIK